MICLKPNQAMEKVNCYCTNISSIKRKNRCVINSFLEGADNEINLNFNNNL